MRGGEGSHPGGQTLGAHPCPTKLAEWASTNRRDIKCNKRKAESLLPRSQPTSPHPLPKQGLGGSRGLPAPTGPGDTRDRPPGTKREPIPRGPASVSPGTARAAIPGMSVASAARSRGAALGVQLPDTPRGGSSCGCTPELALPAPGSLLLLPAQNPPQQTKRCPARSRVPVYPLPAGVSLQSRTAPLQLRMEGLNENHRKSRKFSMAPGTAELRVTPYDRRVAKPINLPHPPIAACPRSRSRETEPLGIGQWYTFLPLWREIPAVTSSSLDKLLNQSAHVVLHLKEYANVYADDVPPPCS